jgi:hypothetical protein
MSALGRLAAVLAFLLSATGVGAQPIEIVERTAVPLNLDLAVPESPAFTGLGLAPEKISRPATPREFASALLSGLDKNGNFQAGVALDTAPYLLMRGDDLTLGRYRATPDGFNVHRQLARLQLSLATTKGTEDDDEAVRLGLGLRATPWSRGDPRLDDALVACFGEVAASLPGRPASETPFEEMPEDFSDEPPDDAGARARIDEYFERVDAWERAAIPKSEACVRESEKRLEKASAWDIGAAPTWIQPSGGDDDIEWGGGTFWTSFAYGFEEWFQDGDRDDRGAASQPQLIAHVRVQFDEQVAEEAATDGFVDQDTVVAGLRLRMGPARLPFSLEAAYLHEDPEDGEANDAFQGSLGADIPVWDQVWVQVGLGGSVGRDDDRIQIGGTIKWGGREIDFTEIAGALKESALAGTGN